MRGYTENGFTEICVPFVFFLSAEPVIEEFLNTVAVNRNAFFISASAALASM